MVDKRGTDWIFTDGLIALIVRTQIRTAQRGAFGLQRYSAVGCMNEATSTLTRAESEADWDLAAQPAHDYEVDQRINW